MKILFIGDVYSDIGVEYLTSRLPELKTEYKPNLIIVNAENSGKNGRGITHFTYKHLMKQGVSLITMGNHTWGQKELETFIDDSNIIRPLNDKNQKGSGYKIVKYNDKKILVINVLGRIYMNDNDIPNPFTIVEELLDELKGQYDYSFCDIHAEATSEKIAFAHHFDGKINVIVGTHTHVQTNDNKILPNGTLYISDVGMTGALNGVIGVDKEIIIDRFINGYSLPNKTSKGKAQLSAVIVEIEPAKSIKKVHIHE